MRFLGIRFGVRVSHLELREVFKMNRRKIRIFSNALVALFAVACSEVPAPTEAEAAPSAAPPAPEAIAAPIPEPATAEDAPVLIAAVDPVETASAAPAVLVAAAAAPAAAAWEKDFTALLQKYAGSNGVSYKKWHANKADIARLNSVTDSIASADLSGMSSKQKLSFYINAYNAWILKRILDVYPVKGPGNGSTIKRTYFFKSKSITVAGKETSFSALENDVIRPTFGEPRIHFALNCASASCPPLHNRAFEAGTLDATLTSLTRAFVNRNNRGFQVSGKKAQVSKIFDWYSDDFKSAGGALAYINKYRDTPVSSSLKVEFMDYDWSLNEAK